MSALIALLSAISWGTSDFFAGVRTKTHPAVVVVGWTQGLALLGLTAVVAIVRPGSVFGPTLPWAMAAGLAGMIGLLFFYTALATGTMGVVAPIASMGVIVPIVLGVATGDAPSLLAWVGMAVAVVGILLASGPELSGAVSPRPVLFALAAAVSFGTVMFCVDRGARSSILLTLWTMRATSVSVLVLVALIARRLGDVQRREIPALAAIGAGDALANGLFGWASSMGQVAITAVLGSLYPVATILLARVLMGERLRAIQQVGVVAALAGAALIAA